MRHAAPAASVDAPPAAWPLSAPGRTAARALQLPPGTRAVTSDERKAVETLALAGVVDAAVDPRFGEVRRPPEPLSPTFREARRAWVEGVHDERHTGWEPHAGAALRFDAAVRAHAGGRGLVVARHGMVLAAWLVAIGRVSPGPPAGESWARLGLPDVVTVDLDR